MRPSARSRPLLVLAPIAGAVVVGMVFTVLRTARAHVVPPTYGEVPAFVLIDQDGQPVSTDTLRGSVWVADFIFTRCAGQCPLMSAQMARLARALRHHRSVKLVSFTVDPEWDTPPVLADYAKSYGASGDQWSFVTGDPQELFQLCQDGFRLAVAEGGGTTEEPITHSVRWVLVDPTGQIRGYYDATDATQLARLRRDLRRLLRNPS